MYAINYKNIAWFDKIMTKIKRCSFFASQCTTFLLRYRCCVAQSHVIMSVRARYELYCGRPAAALLRKFGISLDLDLGVGTTGLMK